MFSSSIIRICSILIILLWSYDLITVLTLSSATEGDIGDEILPLLFRGIIMIPAILALILKHYLPSLLKNGLFLVLLFIESLMATSRWWADDPVQPGFLYIMVGIPMTVVLALLLLSDRAKEPTTHNQ